MSRHEDKWIDQIINSIWKALEWTHSLMMMMIDDIRLFSCGNYQKLVYVKSACKAFHLVHIQMKLSSCNKSVLYQLNMVRILSQPTITLHVVIGLTDIACILMLDTPS